MVDKRLGRYVVMRKLATGGMADVFLARTAGIEGFERHVVLKRIRTDYAGDARFTSMFLDEAKLAATLHHQNIVQVFDIGEEGGEYFFTMEYLHGEDLRTLLDEMITTRGNVPLGHLVAIGAGAASGLHYAHERRGADRKPLGIVHRDVSPSNIIVGYDGSVKLVDFGIARAAVSTPEPRFEGKLGYMSPEQLRNRAIDRRSDVYSLGVVLYELATNDRLFAGASDEELADAIVNGRIPLPRVRRPDLPNELSMILMRALAPDPDRRFQSAGELREALDQFATRAGLAVSNAVLADYMRKVFGEAPEPWLEGRPSRRTGSVRTLASGSHRSKPTTKPPTRTTSKLGWEATPTPSASTWTVGKIAALATIPLLVVIALLVRELVTDKPAPAPTETTAAAGTFATIDPSPPPPPAPPVRVAKAEPTPAPEPKKPTSSSHRHAAVTPTPEAPQLPTVVSEGDHKAPEPPPPVEVAPPPPPPPPPVEPQPQQLSTAVVQGVAGDHARKLAKCEGTETLHGEIAVRFAIDQNGVVTKSQISSSLKKPIIEGCILRSLQRWRFPKQTQPGVRGLYTLVFQ
jgi:serine/threonine protein kinase